MNERQIKKLINEEIKKVLKEEESYVNPDDLTPEQEKIRNLNAAKLMSEPTFQQLIKKYGLFVNLYTLKGFGLIVKR